MDALTAIPLTSTCSVTLKRTLCIPDDGRDDPLPPSLGTMPVWPADDGAYVVPMRRAEALWISFDTARSRPHALKVGIGGVDALSGETFVPDRLSADPQDSVVLPDQPWLDGINAGDGVVRQFVAVPLGEGLTVEAQLTGAEREGGLTLSAFAARSGRFADEDPCGASKRQPARARPWASARAAGWGRRSTRTTTGRARGSPGRRRGSASSWSTLWPSRTLTGIPVTGAPVADCSQPNVWP